GRLRAGRGAARSVRRRSWCERPVRRRRPRSARNAGTCRGVRRDARSRAEGGRRLPRHRGTAVRGARMIRVAVADDQALVRSGFAVLLRSADDIEVVGEAADGAEAVELVTREQPDVVLMDIRMPEMDCLEATRRRTATTATHGRRRT